MIRLKDFCEVANPNIIVDVYEHKGDIIYEDISMYELKRRIPRLMRSIKCEITEIDVFPDGDVDMSIFLI